MKTDDFDYFLPEELIAQTPLTERSASRLLVVDRKKREFLDRKFTDVLEYLRAGDALVLNETKVLPARIRGVKAETGGAVELLLLKDLGGDVWECLARPQKRLKVGAKIWLGEGAGSFEGAGDAGAQLEAGDENVGARLEAEVLEILDEGVTKVKFSYDGIFLEILDQLGTMPLPPYIHERLEDQDRYQTVYARRLGSAAAPTAGLHFTPEMLERVREKGVKIAKLNLNVGLGTFRPVQVDDVTKHKMHTETYELSRDVAETLNEVRRAGGKIFAVGTTTVRTLETVAQKVKRGEFGKTEGIFHADAGETSIFIYPPYKFLGVDGLITNFHLPKSTLLMLVSAFSERELILEAYEHAVAEKYRFFSFGDAMLIV